MENPSHDSSEENPRPTIASALMTSLDQRSKANVDYLENEAESVIVAAADTTGNAMTTILRCVVTASAIYQKLHAELKDAFPEESVPLKYNDLEKLPYLVSSLTDLTCGNCLADTRED